MLEIILTLFPSDQDRFPITYTNIVSLLYKKTPSYIRNCFCHINFLLTFLILLRIGNSRSRRNKQLHLKIQNFKKYKKSMINSVFRSLIDAIHFLLINSDKLILSSLLYKYTQSPLIHMQMFLSAITYWIYLHPSLWKFSVLNPVSLSFIVPEIFKQAINPKIPIRKILKRNLHLILLLLYPTIFLYLTDHVPPNSSFEYTSRFRTHEKVDLCVLDRSIITVVNTYNRQFLNGSDAIRGGHKEASSLWRIIKVHTADGLKENVIDPVKEYERLFIRDGDDVMLLNMRNGIYLDALEGKGQFTSCAVSTEPVYWKVHIKTESLKCRITKVRLQHVKTGRFLSVRDEHFYASTEGLHKGRDFLVEDCRIEEYYRQNIHSDLVSKKIEKYPEIPNYYLAIELFFSLMKLRKNILRSLLLPKTKEEYNKSFSINRLMHHYITIGSFIFGILLLINYVLYKKYGIYFYLSSYISPFYFYLCSLIPQIFLGTTIENYTQSSYFSLVLLLQLVGDL